MNPFFARDGKKWHEFPRYSYGRIDQIEPREPTVEENALFAFDVVDANWTGFSSKAMFNLQDLDELNSAQALYWRKAFSEPGTEEDPYLDAKIYRIEISCARSDPKYSELIGLAETDWVKMTLDGRTGFEVDVFGNMFSDPVVAYLSDVAKVDQQLSAALTAAFDMDKWPIASDADVEAVLSHINGIEFLTMYDIGQGSANGLLDAAENVQLYFDLGCGVYRNHKTAPNPLRFCWNRRAPIILSHWDSDHWAGANSDPLALSKTWIAPKQSISTTHTTFASSILAARGRLLVWNPPGGRILKVPFADGKELRLTRCLGSTRNGSGIACVMENPALDVGWLLTGDAGYDEIDPSVLPNELQAIVVPHHGADMGIGSVPPSRPSAHSYARLLYSFGPDNSHGRYGTRHPTVAAMNAHKATRWGHGGWTVPGENIAGSDVLASADHTALGSPTKGHLSGAVVGWSGVPTLPRRRPHGTATSVRGCTTEVDQV